VLVEADTDACFDSLVDVDLEFLFSSLSEVEAD
jgi:hypothetical protein